jgi:penicillin G amidase
MAAILKWIFKKMAKKSLPQIQGTLSIEGLSESVEIIRDKWGVPHIYAENDNDLVFAQGFVHAQERLWQMELYRRTACGRLSELFGELSFESDRLLRTLGFRRVGMENYKMLSPEVQEGIKAYSKGVNAYLNHPTFKLPLEFKLVKHTPEPWSIEDSMAFSSLMAFQLSGHFAVKIPRGQIFNKLGLDKLRELEPLFPPDSPSVLPNGIEFNLRLDGMLKAIEGPFINKGGASNAWAVSGEKTITGKPIHCTDPHLSASLPSIWFLVHMVSPNINVFGVGPPTLPLILIGHNERISWGFTVANVDSEDLFVEKINPEDSTQYEFKGKWQNAEIIEEIIRVKDKPGVFKEKVRITHHGPIVSDGIGYKDQTISLCTEALKPSEAFNGFWKLNKSKGWDDFVNAVKYIRSPQQNISYADVDGNIGSYVSGQVPIRAKGKGRLPVPGWTGEYEWVDYVPFEKMPHQFNPKRGYLATANNNPINDKNYPYYLSSNWDPGYRAKRILDVLGSKEKVTIDDCKKLHTDVFSGASLELIDRLKDIQDDDSDVTLALKILREWDGFAKVESVAQSVIEYFHDIVFMKIIESGLSSDLAKEVWGTGFHPLLKSTTVAYHGDTNVLFNLLDNPDSWWVKQAGGRTKVIVESLKEAVLKLRKELGDDHTQWHWGKINKITYPHAMAMKKPLDKVFNVGPYPIGGNKHTILQMGHPFGDHTAKIWAPSYRQIVNLADLNKSYVILPPGQSGNLASPHYRDLFEYWYRGDYIPMLFNRDDIEKNAEGKLTLQ